MTATPYIFDLIYPKRTWRIKSEEKHIYLTFDDGPIPIITPWLLETLENYKAKASFFVVGENVNKHPQILKDTYGAGHTIANHTYNHLNGWKTPIDTYLENVASGKKVIEDTLGIEIDKFRPPYGRLKKTQAQSIITDHEIVMWSVLSKDYDSKITSKKCLENSIKATKKGSIVLFHDSLKAAESLQKVLPEYLEYFTQEGFKFLAL